MADQDLRRLRVDERTFRERFNREPVGFEHDLAANPLFDLAHVRALARRYAPTDAFVAEGAPEAKTGFYAGPAVALSAAEALDHLGQSSLRVLLKRLERYDQGFRQLLDALFAEVVERSGGLGSAKVVRLESFLFVSSARTITPFHFDPELGFFFQIQGAKTYHLYSPTVVTERELERHYAEGVIDIGQVPLEGRDPAKETVFALEPGRGHHQPMNSPHWVETGTALSVSYSFAFETDATRASTLVHGFNHYARRLGAHPHPPGHSSLGDAAKATGMKATRPLLDAYWGLRKRLASRPAAALTPPAAGRP